MRKDASSAEGIFCWYEASRKAFELMQGGRHLLGDRMEIPTQYQREKVASWFQQ